MMLIFQLQLFIVRINLAKLPTRTRNKVEIDRVRPLKLRVYDPLEGLIKFLLLFTKCVSLHFENKFRYLYSGYDTWYEIETVGSFTVRVLTL